MLGCATKLVIQRCDGRNVYNRNHLNFSPQTRSLIDLCSRFPTKVKFSFVITTLNPRSTGEFPLRDTYTRLDLCGPLCGAVCSLPLISETTWQIYRI